MSVKINELKGFPLFANSEFIKFNVVSMAAIGITKSLLWSKKPVNFNMGRLTRF